MSLNTKADTTSHNFVFQIDTLGEGNSSLLNDVFIIDENNIWAVGEIYLKNANGQPDPTPYNAAQWDGTRWNLHRFYYRDDQNNLLLFTPIRGVFAFGANDVWFAAGSVFRWNGNFIQSYLLRSTILSGFETIEKLWGTSNSNLYGVGNAGTIVHFNGSSWQKLASGTAVDIQDIWGAVDAKTGQPTILAVASLVNYGRALNLLQIQGATITPLDTTGLQIAESSVWFEPGKAYYIGGDGLFKKTGITEKTWSIAYKPSIYIDRVRANSSNDVFLCGSYGFLAHYNGLTWKNYTDKEVPSFYSRYKGLAVRRNLIVAVGWLEEQAVILRGKRN